MYKRQDQWNPKVTSPTGDPYTIESTGIKTFKTVDGLLSQIEPFFAKALGYDNLDTAVSEMLSRDSVSTDALSMSSVKDYITSLYIILSYASLVDDVNGGGRQNAPYAQYILKGALVDFKGLKLEDINQAVDKDMPCLLYTSICIMLELLVTIIHSFFPTCCGCHILIS